MELFIFGFRPGVALATIVTFVIAAVWYGLTTFGEEAPSFRAGRNAEPK